MDVASDTLKQAESLRYRAMQQLEPPKCEVIYKIHCFDTDTEELYLDEPWVVETGPYDAHLRGSHAIPHLELHLERNKEITFIVYRNFECCAESAPKTVAYHSRVTRTLDSDPSSFFKSEDISIVAEDLSETLQEMADLALQGIPHPKFNRRSDDDISFPYLWWFHRRKEIDLISDALSPTFQKHLEVFQTYIHGRLEKEWSAVDSLLAQGRITAKYIRYLFVCSTSLGSLRTKY